MTDCITLSKISFYKFNLTEQFWAVNASETI